MRISTHKVAVTAHTMIYMRHPASPFITKFTSNLQLGERMGPTKFS